MYRVQKMLWVYTLALVSGAIVTVILGIVPFFAYGLHLEGPMQVAGGTFDPKNYPLFDYHSVLGSVTHAVALSAFATIPVWAIPCSAVLIFSLIRFRLQLSSRVQVVVWATVILGVGLSLFYFTPFGHLLLTWHAD
jgi:hypothetical protein